MVSVFEQCKARVEYGKASAEKWWKAGASRPTGRRTFLETVSIVAQRPRRGIKKRKGCRRLVGRKLVWTSALVNRSLRTICLFRAIARAVYVMRSFHTGYHALTEQL